MTAKQYNTAGWVAVTLVPLYFIATALIIVQEIISIMDGTGSGLAMGPGDFIASVLGLVSAYLLLVFRRLLRERYNFTGVNKLLLVTIVADLAGSLILMPLFFLIEFSVGAILAFAIPGIIALGVLYITIARRLLAVENRLNSMISAYANVLLLNGAFYCSVVLSPIAAIFIEPIVLVMLGMVFLREKEQAEFV